jgi:ParB-like chromosome segregation protein Spo0J
MDPWRDRIVGEASIDPTSLLPHPANWRIHGPLQRDAMAGILSEVGWVQRLVVNQRNSVVVDGHLRLALALDRHEPTVPVLYVDLDEAEERLILSTLDPLSALAESNKDQLAALLHSVQSGDAAVQQLLSELAEREGITPPEFLPVGPEDQGRLDTQQPLTCPACGHEWVP